MRTSLVLCVSVLAGASAPAFAGLVLTTSTGNGSPGLAVSSTDLLQTAVASVASTGDFTRGDGGSGEVAGVPVLTDGGFGPLSNPVSAGVGTAGNAGGFGKDLTYTLDTTVNTFGYDLSAIDIFSGWNDFGRDGIRVEVLYSTVSDPGNFISLVDVNFDGNGGFPSSWNRATLTDDSGVLATGVGAVRFNFNLPVENGWTGYRELDVIGAATVIPEPTAFALVVPGMLLAMRRVRRD